jgi:hypothetical protein
MSEVRQFKQLVPDRHRAAEPGDRDEYDPEEIEPTFYKPVFMGNARRAGFQVVLVEHKRRFWIYYHNIGNLMFEEDSGTQYIGFTHQGLAVSIQGRGLIPVYNLIGDGRLRSIYEPNGLPPAPSQGPQPTITAILVTDAQQSHGLTAPRPELVRAG